jgi:2-polyprenyl-3-methyl-5-hydroxy-6-metoxy-1,4-benzoquinol methylase
MDDVARHNIARWAALSEADALFTRPWLDQTPESARASVDPEGLLGPLDGAAVLCLAGGGGQQSAAFALLGANVTVFDLSADQLERDRHAAKHYGIDVRTIQGDMRDLSPLGAAAFDVVYQPHSLGFVPDARLVFAQVARVLRPGGVYHFAIANPFYAGLSERDWNGEGYTLKLPYVDGAEVVTPDADWVYPGGAPAGPVPECREYRQTLSKLLNGLVAHGFSLRHLSDSEHLHPDASAPPGTWDHRNAIAPAWLAIWARLDGCDPK